MNKSRQQQARSKALAILLYRPRTKKELTDKLLQAGFVLEEVEDAIAYAESFHYIDDKVFTENYIYSTHSNRSRQRLRFDLKKKGVPDDIITECLEHYNGESLALKKAFEKKLNGRDLLNMDQKEREKIIAFLIRRGFQYSDVLNLLDNLKEV